MSSPLKERVQKLSTDSLFSAYCIGHDLYIERKDGKKERLTDDGLPTYSYSDDEQGKPGCDILYPCSLGRQ